MGDIHHVFMDWRMRLGGGPGNGSQFLFELEGRLDPAELRARLDRLLEIAPALGAGLRGWPWFRWVPREGHRIPLTVVEEGGSADELFARWYAEPFPPLSEPSFQVVLAPGDQRSLVLIRWLHPLTDAPGCDLVCRLLDGEGPAGFRIHDEPPSLPRRARGPSRLRLFVALHRVVLLHLLRAFPPAVQPSTRRGEPAGVLFHTFDAQETEAIDARSAELAGPLDTNSFLLGVVAAAAARVLGPPGWRRLCVPVPINLRPRAWKGPVLANYMSSVLLSLPASRLRTLPAAIAEVRRRWRAALRGGEDGANFTILSLARWLPAPLMRFVIEGPAFRDPGTLYTSYVELRTGEGGTFLGLPLRRGLIASAVLRPPGLAIAFVRCAGRLTAIVPSRGFARPDEVLAATVDLLRGEP